MIQLPSSYPDIHHNFLNGLFVVRRSDRQWGGIPTDQIIEQCIMGNLKISGGLTHGSDFSEIQRNIWTLAMPICVSVYQCMQEITKTSRKSGEQNQEIGPSRVSRD